MKVKNWTLIDPVTTGNGKLPAGGYVARITAVEDVPSKEYLWVEFDIAEGEYAGHFSDDFAKSRPYIHRFSRSYKDSAEGFFSAFLVALEESNRNRFSVEQWQRTCDEHALVGLEIGIVVQTELYTSNTGEDKERNEVVGIYATQDIRNGDYKLPEPKDSRTNVPTGASAYQSASNDAIPF